MKKNIGKQILKCVSLVVFSLYLLPLNAQVGSSFKTNLFISGKVGGGLYSSASGSNMALGGGFGVGKWIAEPLALRASADLVNAAGFGETDDAAMRLFLSMDAIWDLWTDFGKGPQDGYVRFYPFIGIGAQFRSIPDDRKSQYNVFQVSFGLHVPFSFQRHSNLAGFLEFRRFCFPEDYDNGEGQVGMNLVTLGLTHRFNVDPYHRRTAQESHTVRDDWFAGAAIGVNYSAFDIITNPNRGGLSMVGVAPEIFVGRNYSNFWTLRVEFTGLSAHEMYDTTTATAEDYKFTYLHTDLMVNVSNAIYFKRGVKWNLLPYIGVGPVWRYDDKKICMAGDMGIMLRRYINEAGDFFVDAKYVMIPPHVGGGRGPSGSIYGVGIPSITVGYIHNFGHTSTRYRLPASFSIDCVY